MLLFHIQYAICSFLPVTTSSNSLPILVVFYEATSTVYQIELNVNLDVSSLELSPGALLLARARRLRLAPGFH